ncbi:hypothetical protein DAPPUDRAFT_113753 [Daphnia pulex]|uniref:Uncharacterized protein n=1 Tax=Daphnia pulex TaxID=6669 RepID=E9HFZ6_DAPPU|nr:hypothetical protein DAPPUDRAFT_113753 [Daphnia pulex]|eukprot:EFX69303.1 hypothetical protein DAPPUDRAFT_113753 [Daphnia pulex]
MWEPSAKDARFRTMTYIDVDVFLFCFSIACPLSLENIPTIWKLEVNRRCPNTPIVLVGNKKDLRNDAVTITARILLKLEQKATNAESLFVTLKNETYKVKYVAPSFGSRKSKVSKAKEYPAAPPAFQTTPTEVMDMSAEKPTEKSSPSSCGGGNNELENTSASGPPPHSITLEQLPVESTNLTRADDETSVSPSKTAALTPVDTLRFYGDKNVATDEASGAPKDSHAEKNPAATTAERANIVEKSLPSIGISVENYRAYSGQDVIILTAVQTFSSLSTWVKSYEDNKVNAHLVHFGVSTTKVDIAQLTRYGSSNFVPNVINNRAMSAYSWVVNTLQSVYGKTRTHRAKPSVQVAGFLLLPDDENEAINVRSFTLTQPNGLRNDTTDLAIIKKDFLTFTLESALEPLPQGLWRFEIIFQRSSSLTDKRLDIWAESANSSQIQLKTWNSALDNQLLDFTKAPVGLYAQLTQNNKPIRGANVTAFVYVSDSGGSTSSLLAEIRLMDEGISGLLDVTSGDGIYSGFMIKPSNSSFSYSVYYRAYGVNSLAEVDNGVYSRQPTTGSVIPMSDPVPAAIQFNRFEYRPTPMGTHSTGP